MQKAGRISYEEIAVELIRGLRGRRSQVAFSKRLGYRSNMVQRWEVRQCWPSAADFFQRGRRAGVDIAACYERFYGRRPDWLSERDANDPQVAAFLSDLRGKAPIGELAARVGTNRFTVSRWLKGSVQPRLPDFLAMIDASSRRLLDFIAGLIDPLSLPAQSREWARLEQARETAYTTPWSHGVLRALELNGAKRVSDQRSWLAHSLGVPASTLNHALDVLRETGQIELIGGRLVPTASGDVDTGRDPRRARELEVRWAETALERLRDGSPGLFGYAVFAISRRDLRRLRDIQLQYVRQLQAVVAASQRGECVGLFCTHLLDLAQGPDNALRIGTSRPAAAERPQD